MVPRLKGENNPIPGGNWSDENISWLASSLCLGGFLTTGFMGRLSERFGRKGLGYISAFPIIICWFLKAWALSPLCIYMARFLVGVTGAGVFFLNPLYIGEIASEEIRGILGSILVLAVNIGILYGYTAGILIDYTALAYWGLVFPIAFLIGFYFLPETPVYLVRQNRLNDALK